jgi:uncharacterized oxidoreductase
VVHSVNLRIDAFDFDLVRQELATDLHAAIEIALRFLPHLKRRKSAALVNVTTGQVHSPNACTPIYSAAEVGFHTWIQAWRSQLRDTGLEVFEVMSHGNNDIKYGILASSLNTHWDVISEQADISA